MSSAHPSEAVDRAVAFEPVDQVVRDAIGEGAIGIELISDDELATRWRTSRGTIHALRQKGMPSLKIGRSRRYDPIACRRWLEEHQAEFSESVA